MVTDHMQTLMSSFPSANLHISYWISASVHILYQSDAHIIYLWVSTNIHFSVSSTINKLCVTAKIMLLYISCHMKRIFSIFLIPFPILTKYRVIKFICIVSRSRSVVIDSVFEGVCVRDSSIDWQEKLTDLVLMHYNESALQWHWTINTRNNRIKNSSLKVEKQA